MDPDAQSTAPAAIAAGGEASDDERTGIPALDALDDTIDRALGTAATGFWGIASAVSAAVPADAQAVISGRGARSLAGLSSAARGVAATVQRNAAAVEEALAASASIGTGASPDEHPATQRDSPLAHEKQDLNHDRPPSSGSERDGSAATTTLDAPDDAVRVRTPSDSAKETDHSDALADLPDAGFGIVGTSQAARDASRQPAGYVKEDLDVNAELARAAQNLRESVVGKTVGGLFGSLSMWAGGDDVSAGNDELDERPRQMDAPTSRFEGLVRDLELNPDTYCEPASDLDAFAAWVKDGFDLDKLESQCVSLLERHPSIADLYERVVPRVIDEETFWMRYFYARHVLDNQEEERRKLLERAAGGAEQDAGADTGWDDDEDEEEDQEDEDTETLGVKTTGSEGKLDSVSAPAGEGLKTGGLVTGHRTNGEISTMETKEALENAKADPVRAAESEDKGTIPVRDGSGSDGPNKVEDVPADSVRASTMQSQELAQPSPDATAGTAPAADVRVPTKTTSKKLSPTTESSNSDSDDWE